jgi:hypothetical protein
MEDKKYTYLRFPLQILKGDFYNMRKVCNDAINYGVIEYMERKKYTGWKGYVQSIDELGFNKGFNRSDYSDQPKAAINHLEEMHYAEPYASDIKFYKQFKDSAETKITCSIKDDLLFEFKKPKTEFEIAVFRFFIALNSIQGTDEYGRGSWDRFFAVMLGYNTDLDIKPNRDKKEAIALWKLTEPEQEIYLKYSTKRMKEKIVKSLELDWHLKWISAGNDGIFFSWTLGYKELETTKLMMRVKRKSKNDKRLGDKKKGEEEAYNDLKSRGLFE